jgi:hypothetical protein
MKSEPGGGDQRQACDNEDKGEHAHGLMANEKAGE